MPALRPQNEVRMAPIGHLLAPAALLLLAAGGAWAQGYSLFVEGDLVAARPSLFEQPQPGQPSLGAPRQPLIRARAEIPDTAEAEEARGGVHSLFIGRAGRGLFAPATPGDREPSGSIANAYGPLLSDDPVAEMIRNLIAHAEAGRDGYGAVQHGARRKPGKPPTQMTLGDVFAWIEGTPGQPHAIGRYQFIPSTLARLVNILGAGPEELFSPRMQDRLADILLHEAGLAAYRSGELTRHEFMYNLAKIWAGLPTSSGHSHYDGYAGNAATITWTQFDSEMARIFQG